MVRLYLEHQLQWDEYARSFVIAAETAKEKDRLERQRDAAFCLDVMKAIARDVDGESAYGGSSFDGSDNLSN